jgi:hypothetical protein
VRAAPSPQQGPPAPAALGAEAFLCSALPPGRWRFSPNMAIGAAHSSVSLERGPAAPRKSSSGTGRARHQKGPGIAAAGAKSVFPRRSYHQLAGTARMIDHAAIRVPVPDSQPLPVGVGTTAGRETQRAIISLSETPRPARAAQAGLALIAIAIPSCSRGRRVAQQPHHGIAYGLVACIFQQAAQLSGQKLIFLDLKNAASPSSGLL